ncbi:MAG: ATP-dependent DNA helicase RecQ [Rikenellaceae bacterium]
MIDKKIELIIIFVSVKPRRKADTSNQGLSKEEVLRKYWGYESFRGVQGEIVDSVLGGCDTLALMPTGGGKSLTYQVPALMKDGVCIVVTPLIALMKDQVDSLRKRSILAEAIHSGMSRRQIDIALDNCTYGNVKFLYISPERITTDLFEFRLSRMTVSFIAIDEAHCISQWGYDFRPSYLRIVDVRRALPSVACLALTASATGLVCEDIMKNLSFKEHKVIRGDFSRRNLSFALRHVDDKSEQLLRLVRNVEGSGIVYMRTREGCEKLSEFLIQNGFTATFYHAGLPHTERSIRQDEWITGKRRIIVATNAFGMGIDKPDVRFVVHYTMCDSLESYYQEAGRAGRDGARSYALLLVSSDDESKIKRRFEMEFPSLELVKDVYEKVCSSLAIGIGEGEYSSHVFNMFDFCQREKLFAGSVRSSLKLLEMNGYMSLTDEMENPARIMFCIARDDLYKVRVGCAELDPFIRIILRLYDGVFSDFRRISESEIAHWSGYTVARVKELLKELWMRRIIRYIPSNRSSLICIESERLSRESLYISPDSYLRRKQLYEERFTNMLSYSQNETVCRAKYMIDYFNGGDSDECEACDVCLTKRRAEKASTARDLRVEILGVLKQRPLSVKALISELKAEPKGVVEKVNELLAEGLIEQSVEGLMEFRG